MLSFVHSLAHFFGCILLVHLAISSTPTPGYCLKCDGTDQNDGQIIKQATNEKDCFNTCISHNGATGCEYDGNTCTIHTKQVARGSGKAPYKCWTMPRTCNGKIIKAEAIISLQC